VVFDKEYIYIYISRKRKSLEISITKNGSLFAKYIGWEIYRLD